MTVYAKFFAKLCGSRYHIDINNKIFVFITIFSSGYFNTFI